MPVFNVTVPDSSPLIAYTGSWNDTPKVTTDYKLYQNQTYHLSSQNGDTATLAFNGTGIYIFGARKPEYDGYSVTLDGGSPFEASATAATAQYNVLLYSATALDVTMEHQVVLQNSQGSSQETSLDIDYMVITAGDGDLQTTSQDFWWNQDNSNIVYSANWDTIGGPGYTAQNSQLTYSQGASATVMFEGNAIALYGTTNTDHGLFSVSIDNGPEATFNASAPEPRFQMLLYYANGLPSGQHTLHLIDASPSNGRTNGLELDTVSGSSWSDPPSTPTNALAPSSNSTSSQGTPLSTSSSASSVSGGTVADGTSLVPTTTNIPPTPDHHALASRIIAGSVVAVVVGIALIALGVLLLYRRRNRHQSDVGGQHEVLSRDRPRTDTFYTTPLPGLGMQPMSESSAFISAAPTSASVYALGQQSSSHDTPQALFTGLVPASGTVMSQKQRLAGLYAASSPSTSSHVGSTPQVTDNESEDLHQDFPPPGYGQVFPLSHPL